MTRIGDLYCPICNDNIEHSDAVQDMRVENKYSFGKLQSDLTEYKAELELIKTWVKHHQKSAELSYNKYSKYKAAYEVLREACDVLDRSLDESNSTHFMLSKMKKADEILKGEG